MADWDSSDVVLVLGAGFARAFFPGAPLITDYYDLAEVRNRLAAIPDARQILHAELAACGNNCGDGRDRINSERLMTRLYEGMPYDAELGRGQALRDAYDVLVEAAVEALPKAGKRRSGWIPEPLESVAERILAVRPTCITFNYDELLDRALDDLSRHRRQLDKKAPGWHPLEGYGFHCPYWRQGCDERNVTSHLLLLKLHGSMNWRIKRGAQRSYRLDDFVRDSCCATTHPRKGFDPLVERTPFIVPPLLAKTDLLAEPVLQVVWYHAWQALGQAKAVVFVGCSLPPSDYAARSLFREAIQKSATVAIVNYAGEGDDEGKGRLKEAYRSALPLHHLGDGCFDFGGAEELSWLDRYLPLPEDSAGADRE